MPAADTVLLPICVALALLGVLLTGIAVHRRRPARAAQAVGLVLAPIGLYLSGLLRVVWDFVVSLVAWGGRVVFSPYVWIGLSLLGLGLVLLVVGGFAAERSAQRRAVAAGRGEGAKAEAVKSGAVRQRGSQRGASAVGQGVAPRQVATDRRRGAGQPIEDDPELAEIEALLKSRGIE